MLYRTDEELSRMWYLVGAPDLADVYARAHDAETALEELESKFERQYEAQLEQSEFRRELLERIIELCDEGGTKKELVAAIKTALENSFVEL